MEYKRYGEKIAVRLDKGDEIVSKIAEVCEKENVKAGYFSGIGATDDFTVGVFDIAKKEYEKYSYKGNHEINVLTGNVSFVGGKTYIHAHITCTGENGVVGGHLFSGAVSLTGEIFIEVINGEITREKNEELGINTLVFR